MHIPQVAVGVEVAVPVGVAEVWMEEVWAAAGLVQWVAARAVLAA